ncbi:pentatricopeptide repeat-containing protein At5g04780, mitochondrial-like [Dioscorea cayenensis subsp. rotundata]|uniref:Pentatricopeptide repeat-containing protein At5g04780, mitochondrial-like n=1 Tax=Dioscorea cayennensis subsp. rotundata TaxID=55577 RepID=A0AB40B5S2_DIOCR|nr:pentatricopeptide repeat-containing protein At5g04780, mitochondrial-like [Dioscorea cayenensis subsp. rotundata]XP_039122626.1 pentatricopeptide repeat-containing protein At5g04780, mitochondrial-like [Dioscorea cayenensis subsp. rotundata]XP_039122627.1 pentatricopeptide repeat-containing protein At5g04780, mitochondrial-like [Dioscorea cayenensis subsp. rotundata]XP_039122628.1 pentatricopeptide repeat-containing protein At5g04780, mitochondrial-like [Dioscorea cayenensis subsp. rotundata]
MAPRSPLSLRLSCLLRAFKLPSLLRHGGAIHAKVVVHGFLPDATLETDLLLMYSRCASSDLCHARQVFDQMRQRTMHAWNILFSSYAQSSLYHLVLGLLRPFLDSGFRPDHFTVPALCKACGGGGGVGLREIGMGLHCWAIKIGVLDVVFVSSSVLDMYAKFGRLDDACKVFELMPERDVVAWNAMITGFVRAGQFVESLDLFRRLQLERMGMDWRVIPSVLNACGSTGELIRGKEVHGRVIRCLMFDSDVVIGNALIDMYGKCGCLNDSQRVFACMGLKNEVTWSSMIACLGVHGKGEESLKLYEEMIKEGFKPNSITFTSVLSSCSHSRLLVDGRRVFESIREPSVEHFACMVDLFGRSGDIKQASRLIDKMPMKPSASVWGALLAGCVLHKNVVIGEIAAHKLSELEPSNSSNYVALCGIYDAVGMSDNVSKIRARMRELGISKTPGCSWIIINGKSHTFYQGNISHPFAKRVCEVLLHLHLWIGKDEDVYHSINHETNTQTSSESHYYLLDSGEKLTKLTSTY